MSHILTINMEILITTVTMIMNLTMKVEATQEITNERNKRVSP